ncbi:unnamed protein product [Choristocarpus tenellus]
MSSDGTTDHEDQDQDHDNLDDDSTASSWAVSSKAAGQVPRGEALSGKGLARSQLLGGGRKRSLGLEEEWTQAKYDRLRDLMLRLSKEYPGDIGIMMPLLLNYITMRPGEAFFMAANEPHAYLKGDIMEVMARSDNVVRVALTPKYRDVPLLCEILTYNMGAPPMVEPVRVDTFRKRYSPPIKDFELDDIMVPAGEEYSTPTLPVASLGIVLEGRGSGCDGLTSQKVWPGVVVFIPARTPVTLTSTGGTLLRMCLAHTNMNYFSSHDYCHDEGGM